MRVRVKTSVGKLTLLQLLCELFCNPLCANAEIVTFCLLCPVILVTTRPEIPVGVGPGEGSAKSHVKVKTNCVGFGLSTT